MWAATARPVSLLKVSRHVIEPVAPDFAIVAVNAPRARPTRPFGRGTSWRAVRVARALAVIPSWPRTSPGAFRAVWTFT
jgi:hypothetical protein